MEKGKTKYVADKSTNNNRNQSTQSNATQRKRNNKNEKNSPRTTTPQLRHRATAATAVVRHFALRSTLSYSALLC